MPRPRKAIPDPRPCRGRARITLDGQTFYIGKWGEHEDAYRAIVAEWINKTGRFATKENDPDPITIAEVLAGYWLHAEKYYGFDHNPNRGDCANLKAVIGIVERLYADLPANKFSPLDFKAVRAEMVKLGWARSYVNHSIGKVKRIFAWAVEEVMIPPATWHALLAVKGLKNGRTDAKEKAPVKPIDLDTVEATKEHLRPALRALIDFTLLTGCRPNEACQLRPIDIDKSNPDCWIFRPQRSMRKEVSMRRWS